MKQSIFIVEDESDISKLLKFHLDSSGYEAQVFERVEPAFNRAQAEPPALFLLDIMLPGENGLEACRRIRGSASLASVPVIFITARISEDDRVVGLECGADDYITKPFSPREVLARVEAVLRRTSGRVPGSVIRFGDVELDLSAMVLRVGDKEIKTTTLEFRLLEFLARSPGLVFSRDRLLQAIWGNSRFVSPRSVDVYVSKLRDKIEEDPNRPKYLRTVRGAGYRFVFPK